VDQRLQIDDQALDALHRARAALDAMLIEVKARIENDEAGSADAYQQICYEAAHSAAELAAAEQLLSSPEPSDSLQQALARHFAAWSIERHHNRCASAEAELGLQSPMTTERGFVLRQLASAQEEALGARLLDFGPHWDSDRLDGPHRLLRDSYRRFAEHRVSPVAETIHRKDEAIPAEILDGLSELGCFGLSIPERYGGLYRDEEPDCLSMLLATEELSRASLGAAGSLITRPEVVARSLLAGGTAEQKESWLPRLASGECLCAVAVTEPDYGSDVASMQLRARRCEGGWSLNGAKMWSTFAGRAHVLMVLARSGAADSGHRGLSLFLVEKPSFECFFDGFVVSDEALIGGEAGEGRGFYLTMAGFAGGRIQTAARAVGVMQAAFEQALDYSRQRRTFGRPIGDYQLTRVKLARMASLLHASRRYSYSVAPLMDQGSGDVPASMAKLLASRAAEWVTREAMQIHGGMGYAEESAVSRYFVDARVLSIFEGSEEILALKVIARSLLDQAGGRT
jgi:(2S)-methylsuccinyl-CoA dehydrogenase